jgi:Activator of Hsp90 ATPase homolog 1-like protein
MSEPTNVQMQDLGELERNEDTVLLRFTRRLAHPPQKVWRALVEPAHLAVWFPTTIDGERAAGARLRFRHRDERAEPFDAARLRAGWSGASVGFSRSVAAGASEIRRSPWARGCEHRSTRGVGARARQGDRQRQLSCEPQHRRPGTRPFSEFGDAHAHATA